MINHLTVLFVQRGQPAVTFSRRRCMMYADVAFGVIGRVSETLVQEL